MWLCLVFVSVIGDCDYGFTYYLFFLHFSFFSIVLLSFFFSSHVLSLFLILICFCFCLCFWFWFGFVSGATFFSLVVVKFVIVFFFLVVFLGFLSCLALLPLLLLLLFLLLLALAICQLAVCLFFPGGLLFPLLS